MRVDLVGHAALLVRSGELTLLTDPWWAGPAYQGQWYPFPFPTPERYDLSRLDAIYLSHGHEDHLHEATLRELPRSATVVIPRSYDADNRRYLEQLGFSTIREIPSGGTLTLRRGRSRMRLTLFTCLGDSLLAVEADGQVMIDANDALHCARPEVIDEYCLILRERFGRIDDLFCGFGGASYFPNCFRVTGKDDRAVARRREESFLHAFARIAEQLSPRRAYPFAAHFVLPAPAPSVDNWWISASRLTMERPAAVLGRLCPSVAFHDLQPGDHVEDGRVHESSAPAASDPDEVRRQVLERYAAPSPASVDRTAFVQLLGRVRRVATARAGRLGAVELRALVRLTDYPGAAIAVRHENGRCTVAEHDPADRALRPHLELETRADLLAAAVDQPFGRDLICIGYGGLVHVRSPEAIRNSLHDRLLELITPFPGWRDRIERHPLRCLKFLWRDPAARLALRQRLRLAPPPAPSQLYSLGAWL